MVIPVGGETSENVSKSFGKLPSVAPASIVNAVPSLVV
jgi:hypothetical protein